MAQCTATSKRTKERCRDHAMHGRTVCYKHGGSIPRGLGLPQTRTGRYSKDMPTRMAARYAEAQQDPELLVLRDEIALLDARLADVLARVDTGESGALWSQLAKSWEAYIKAQYSAKPIAEKTAEMRARLDEHAALLERGRADYAAWAEIGTLLDRRQRFVESERKRYVEMSQMVSLEQAMLFLGAVTDAIRRHVTDQATRAALGRELELLADLPGRALASVRRGTG
jgi:hypothetical protein